MRKNDFDRMGRPVQVLQRNMGTEFTLQFSPQELS